MNEMAEIKFKIWHGSQTPILFHNDLDLTDAAIKPTGIVIEEDNEQWKISDLDIPHPFICEAPQVSTLKINIQ